MFVADLLAALEAAHPADSVRILTRREGIGGQIAAVKVDDAMLVPGEPRTLLIKPAVELREHEQERHSLALAHMQEVQRATRNAVAYRQAADQVLRQAHALLSAGQIEAARQYLHDHLPENRSIAQAVAASHPAAPAAKPAPGAPQRAATARS